MKLSNRAANMQASPLRKLIGLAEVRKKEGITVYHLNIGQPDIKTDEIFYEQIKKIQENPIAYAHSAGIAETREAWNKYYKSVDIELDAEEIIITNGGSEAIIFAMCAVADPGDEILAFEPYYTNYNGFGSIGGVNITAVTLSIENGFHLPSKKEIEEKITDKTKAIIFTNPSNPTGTVFTKDELQVIVDIAKERGLFILADETYREFSYTGEECFSLMNFPEVENQVIQLDSVSKRFCLCGARMGVMASHNKEIMQAGLKMGMARLCVPSIEQRAIIPFLENSKKYVMPIIVEFKKRRDVLSAGLKEISGINFKEPEGAFYIICSLPVKSSEDFAKWLIEKFDYNGETVLLAPAPGFYADKNAGQNEVRLAYVLNADDLEKSLVILKKALEKYQEIM
ncbi:MAG: pyridoxal phosphate-dependent aminotransferase [Patescibacteria group bacterium]